MSNNEQLRDALNEAVQAMRSLTASFQAMAAALDRSSPEAQTPDRPITIERIRDAMRDKQGEGKIAQIRELLMKYDAGRLSEVKEEDYARFLRDVEAL